MGLGTAGGFEVYVQNRLDGDAKSSNEVKSRTSWPSRSTRNSPGIDLLPPPCRSFRRGRQTERRWRWASVAPMSIRRCRAMGALYVNDFNKAGRVYRVQLQAEAAYRMKPDDIGKVYVRSATANAMIPLSASARSKRRRPEQVERFNGFIAAKVMGDPPGVSSGDAIKIVEEVAAATAAHRLRHRLDRPGLPGKAQFRLVASGLGFAIIMVFLILAAQYENGRCRSPSSWPCLLP